MQTIGERLQEARKRKNITIREAAEATKIRGEFLSYFEDNHFDINLPDIYCRGFVKLYAKYLGLDEQQIGVDYNAYKMGSIRVSHSPRNSSGRESLGRIEIDDTPSSPAAQKTEPTTPLSSARKALSRIPFARGQQPVADQSAPTAPSSLDDIPQLHDKSLYWKIGGVIGATLLVALFLTLIVRVLSSDSSSERPAPSDSGNTVASIAFPQTLTLQSEASGRLLFAVVPDNGTGNTSLAPGQSITLAVNSTSELVLVGSTTSTSSTLRITRQDGSYATVSFSNSAKLTYDGVQLIQTEANRSGINRVIPWVRR